MKKLLSLLLLSTAVTSLSGCKETIIMPIEYSINTNWAVLDTSKSMDVDTFFVYPTIIFESEWGYASIDDCRNAATEIYNTQASVFLTSTNLYMPLYRQATFDYEKEWGNDWQTAMDNLHNSVGYNDLVDALDYYFENYNQDHPFILAGHSQGSALILNLLEHYFVNHQDRLERMVAAYTIGFAPSADMFERCKYLKFATGEIDTGVVISWNTESPNATGKSLLFPEQNAKIINPLNWKTTDEYCGPELNLGTLNSATFKIDSVNKADAQINLTRGTLMCSNCNNFVNVPGVFQNESLHLYDYSLYYMNLIDNVEKRVEAYLAK